MLVVFFNFFYLELLLCKGILLTRYLHRDSFQQSRLFTVVDNKFQFMFKNKTITKLISIITKKSNNSHYN